MPVTTSAGVGAQRHPWERAVSVSDRISFCNRTHAAASLARTSEIIAHGSQHVGRRGANSRIGAPQAVEHRRDDGLWRPMADPDQRLNSFALKGRRAREALLDTFRRDSDFNVLTAAAEAPTRFRDSRIVPILIDGLRDPNASKRILAASALGELADVAAMPDLLAALSDESLQVRDRARYAIAQIRRPAEPG